VIILVHENNKLEIETENSPGWDNQQKEEKKKKTGERERHTGRERERE
jgi:hypothetical protein